jgi:hypothetical protein
VAKAILLRFIIAAVFVVPGWIGMSIMMKSTGGTPPPGSRGAGTAELQVNMTLNQAGEVMAAHHTASGTYAGADLSSVPGARLVRGDALAFCVEAGDGAWLHHLDGSTQQENGWNWGAVRGACA